MKREKLNHLSQIYLAMYKGTDVLNKEMETAFYDYVFKHVGITCFTKNPYSILMRGHYGDCHQGICLGFDSDSLQNKYGYNLLKVNYQREFYNFRKFGDAEETQQYLLTKFLDWEYEDEYRIIIDNSANIAIPYDKNSLREVIIGMSMSNEKQKRIVSYSNESYPHVQIKIAKRNTDRFSIDFI